MERVVEMGGVVFPPVPAFYTNPTGLEEVISHTVSRALEQLGLEVEGMERWTGSGGPLGGS